MRHIKATITAAAILAVSIFTACADLGFGVDVDSDGPSPYFYGGTGPGWNYGPMYTNGTIWNNWGWGYDPGWNNVPANPPFIGNGPGSVFPNRPSRPQRPIVAPGNRPGNGGQLAPGAGTNGGRFPNINGSNPGPVVGGTGIPSASDRPGHMGRN